MTRSFFFRAPIDFGDVDSAKILFYPRFFEYCHRALEKFSEAAFGITYASLLSDKGLGFPTVHIETDYHRPFAYGDEMELEVTLASIGSKSIVMRFRARQPGDPALRIEARITKVCVDMRGFKGTAIPDWMRPGLESFSEASQITG